MKLVVIMGPHAVGKMTVGQELEKITNLKLFHNHIAIDTVATLFEHNQEEKLRLIRLIRTEIFKAFAKSDEYGMIYTYMFAFDNPENWKYISEIQDIFRAYNAEIFFIELQADFQVRIERNKTENRIRNKLLKRDVKYSEKIFRELEAKYRLNSKEGEIKWKNYIKIDNTNLRAVDVAEQIKHIFHL